MLIISFFCLFMLEIIQSIVVIPFRLRNHTTSSSTNEETYSITNFLEEYINRDFYTTIDIGTPAQKLFAVITSNSHIFSLSSDEYIPNIYETSKNHYLPSLSSSFTKIKNITVFDKLIKDKTIISESFYLYNTTKLFKNIEKYEKIKIENMKILYEEEGNIEQKHAIIGLNYDTSNKEIPYIVNELKRLNIINNYDWSFKFTSNTEGLFIIGDIPHNYEKNKNYFYYDSYTKIESSSGGDYSHPWSIYFNQLYFIKNETKIIISQISKCTLDPNLGFIIGNNNYKKLLLKNYFGELIENNICQFEKTDLTKYSKGYVYYGTNGIYDLFTCDKNEFVNGKINYKKQFMPLLFDLPKYNFTFNLSDDDLFIEINNKYYFLVAFPENEGEIYYIQCFLGLPFYQKYRLTFNYDSKTIGFYKEDPSTNVDSNIDDDDDENNNGNRNDNDKKDNSSNGNNYIRIIIEILICIILVIIAFCIGKKINEQRKKRANELNDDNFDYMSDDNNKNINE